MGRRVIWLPVLFLVLTCSTQPSELKQWYEQDKLTAEAATQTDSEFGKSVAISGDYAVVGAYRQDINIYIDTGAVYIYKRTGTNWNLYDTLTGSITNDNFGYDVDISGNYVIIGAPGDDPAAYIYANNGTQFILQKKLTGSVATKYGTVVAIDGDWAVVGDSYKDLDGTADPEGAVYVYYKTENWAMKQILHTAAMTENDLFGSAVDISGSSIVVGAPRNDSTGTDAGAVYIFERFGITWGFGFTNAENRILYKPDAQEGDYFGYSVNICSNRLAAGGKDNGGSAAVFTNTSSGWQSAGSLVQANITATDRLGYAVAVCGDYAVAGTADSDAAATDAGALYLFKPGSSKWDFDSRLTASDAAAKAFLGASVAIDGDYIIGGAPGSTVNTVTNAGAAYIYFRDYIH